MEAAATARIMLTLTRKTAIEAHACALVQALGSLHLQPLHLERVRLQRGESEWTSRVHWRQLLLLQLPCQHQALYQQPWQSRRCRLGFLHPRLVHLSTDLPPHLALLQQRIIRMP